VPDADGTVPADPRVNAEGARRLLVAEHVVTPQGVLDNAVITIRGTRLISCEPLVGAVGTGGERVAGWVVPGFVDTHVHGGGGFDYATESPEVALRARAFHAACGTTSSLASLVTAPIEVLVRQIAMLAELVDDGHFAGIHLEGPFLSSAQRGAHDPDALRHPDAATIDRLISAGRGALAVVTLAPELPGGTAAISQLTAAGVRVAVGHTDADRPTVEAALDAGATIATHIFNAMRGIHHRRPGPIPLLLTDRRVGVELIADGFHLHPDVLRMAAAAAGRERTILVTDAMAASGMPDGEFALGGLRVDVRSGMARMVTTDGRPGAIAGSTLTMARAFEYMTRIVRDISAVAAMASSNPADRLGLREVGRIAPGDRADLCVVNDQGALLRVMQSGQWLPG